MRYEIDTCYTRAYRPEERRTIENQREPGIRELIGEDEASPEAEEKRHGLAYRR
jgi:hypothetical protein